MTQAEASATDMARAELRVEGDTLVVVIAGDWSIEQQLPRFDALLGTPNGAGRGASREAGREAGRGVRTVAFDASELGAWDSSLLIFLMKGQEYCERHKIELDTSGLPGQVPRLLALARAVPERVQQSEPERLPFLARVGTFAMNGLIDTKAAITFSGEVAIAVAGLATRRVHMRWREFWVVVQQNSSGALPIVTLIALLVGVIIAFLGVVVLKRFGAGYYVSYLVGFGMLREMGALMTGIIIAGRTGAGFAAELGSMKITEEIDAYTTLGISPIEHLVLPRLLGLFVMMPLLTIYAYFVGITGGFLVSAALLDLSFTQFMNGLLSAVTLSDALLGVVKAVIFGYIVGVAGCMKGLQGGSDAGAVGRAATSAVVLGITLIIMANAIVDWLAALLDI